MAVTAAPGSIFSLISLLKVEAWGKEKKTQCRKGRYRLTCHRWGRKTPGQGEFLSPRRDGSPGFAPSGAAAAEHQLGVPSAARPRRARPLLRRRAPSPVARDQGTPQLDFFVQFQQSSEEVGPFVPLFIDCVNIAKRRRRSGGPSPSSHRLRREKSPSTRPKYTARSSPAGPSLQLAASPSSGALPTPSRVRQGKPAPGGSALPAGLREGSGCLAHPCAQLGGSGRGPGVAHSVGTPALATQRVPPGPRLVDAFPSLSRFRPLPPLPLRSATALGSECARLWASPGSQGPDLSLAPLPSQALRCQSSRGPARLGWGGAGD